MDIQQLLESFDASQFVNDAVFPWMKNIVFAVLIFLLGRLVAKMVVSIAEKAMGRGEVDPTLINFVTNLLGWVLLLMVMVAALNQLGVDTTSFVALLGF